MDELKDLPLFSGVAELAAKIVDERLPEGPPRAVVAAYLEAGGWRTRRGGVSTS